jgi:hypothetical protein
VRQILTIQNKTANLATAPALSTFASFRQKPQKRKLRLAGLLYSSILMPRGGYRHADNIIAGRSLTGDMVAL